jgi:hypothetical protein
MGLSENELGREGWTGLGWAEQGSLGILLPFKTKHIKSKAFLKCQNKVDPGRLMSM